VLRNNTCSPAEENARVEINKRFRKKWHAALGVNMPLRY
jgi:hypothetical protein